MMMMSEVEFDQQVSVTVVSVCVQVRHKVALVSLMMICVQTLLISRFLYNTNITITVTTTATTTLVASRIN